MKCWQLQDAKARLSEVIRRAIQEGPQAISVRGKKEVIMIAKSEFDRLSKPKPSFVEFMRNSPLVGVELDITRDDSSAREVDL